MKVPFLMSAHCGLSPTSKVGDWGGIKGDRSQGEKGETRSS